MPIFDFACSSCGCKFDLMISSTDKKEIICPQCGSADVKKLLSLFSTSRGSSPSKTCEGCCAAGTGGCAMKY